MNMGQQKKNKKKQKNKNKTGIREFNSDPEVRTKVGYVPTHLGKHSPQINLK